MVGADEDHNNGTFTGSLRAGDERMRRRQGLALAVFAVAVQSPEGALVRAIQKRGVPVNVQLLWCSLCAPTTRGILALA